MMVKWCMYVLRYMMYVIRYCDCRCALSLCTVAVAVQCRCALSLNTVAVHWQCDWALSLDHHCITARSLHHRPTHSWAPSRLTANSNNSEVHEARTCCCTCSHVFLFPSIGSERIMMNEMTPLWHSIDITAAEEDIKRTIPHCTHFTQSCVRM